MEKNTDKNPKKQSVFPSIRESKLDSFVKNLGRQGFQLAAIRQVICLDKEAICLEKQPIYL